MLSITTEVGTPTEKFLLGVSSCAQHRRNNSAHTWASFSSRLRCERLCRDIVVLATIWSRYHLFCLPSGYWMTRCFSFQVLVLTPTPVIQTLPVSVTSFNTTMRKVLYMDPVDSVFSMCLLKFYFKSS